MRHTTKPTGLGLISDFSIVCGAGGSVTGSVILAEEDCRGEHCGPQAALISYG